MKSEGEYYGEISYEGDIFRQILILGELSLRIFDSPTIEWQRNSLNYYFAIKNLEAIVFPYLGESHDEDVRSEILKIKDKYDIDDSDSIQKSTMIRRSKYNQVLFTIEVSNMILKTIIRSLNEIGILIPGQYRGGIKNFEESPEQIGETENAADKL